MKHSPFITGIIALITGGALFACLYILQSSVIGNPENVSANSISFVAPIPTGQAREVASSTDEDYDKPSRLLIPSISVDAKVQHVGLTASNAMGIPTNFVDVAWYKHGAIPGEEGNAVVAGHVDNALGLKGVFKYLSDVSVGDDVYVVDAKGARGHFKIIDVSSYPYNAAPAEEIFGETDRKLLRLITCGGKWIKAEKTYDTRVVVTAEYIPSEE